VPARMTWKPRLRTVLIAVNVLILLLAVAAIGILRLYETELVKGTESELIAQGVLIAAAYREVLIREIRNPGDVSREIRPEAYGLALRDNDLSHRYGTAALNPLLPRLNLASDKVLPPAPDAVVPTTPTDDHAQHAGESITPMIRAAKSMTLAGIRVTDYRGIIVATSAGELGLSLYSWEEVRRALAGEQISLLRERILASPSPPLESVSRRSRVRVFVAIPIVHRDRVIGAVVLSRTPPDVVQALYRYRRLLMSGLVVLLAVVVLVSVMTALTISRPMRALIRQSERVSRGEKGAASALVHPGTYEVDLLSRAFVRMAHALEERAEYVKTFASNVSHGFKTPLTSIRGAVELLQDHFDDMSCEERRRFLQILHEDTDRLQRLVSRLLELARAETALPAGKVLDTGAVLETVAARYREAGLDVTLRAAPDVSAAMSPETLESIISALLENAQQHCGIGVNVSVAASVVSIDGTDWAEITVEDDGPGISEANARQVFAPFFTTSGDRGGSGLGLAIADALVKAHGGALSLGPVEVGTQFRLVLPAR
jgi:signal transduction histidine kinase